MTTNSSDVCPEVTFTCTAVDLLSTTFRWFSDGDQIALYAISPTDTYPLEPMVTRDDVNVTILQGNLNQNNVEASYISTLTVNILALQSANISFIECGSLASRANITLVFSGADQG